MQYSEALRRRAIEIARRHGADRFAGGALPRGANRIIAAGQLADYTPLRLDEFGDTPDDDPAFATTPAIHEAAGEHEAAATHEAAAACHEAPAASRSTTPAAYRAAFDAGYKAGLQAGHQAGHEAGLAQGFERGIAEAAEQAAAEHREAQMQAGTALAHRIDSLSDALAARFVELEAEAADEVVALALELARQALRSSLAVRPEAIVDVVREALAALLDERSRVRVHLNPADAELVRAALDDRMDKPGHEIVCDPAITPGGCRIETPRAEVDAQLETRWQRTLAAIGRNEDGSIAE